MKQNTTKSLATFLLAASATSLSAIERPVPAEQPKERLTQEANPELNQALPMPKLENALADIRPYLGVMGNPTTEAMSAQLDLEPGAGLTLLFVAEGSPAHRAGLKRHDIITKIAGDKVGDQDQLRKAIYKHKPNAKVQIDYISGGKVLNRQVELGVAPQPTPAVQPFNNNRAARPQLKNNNGVNGAIHLDMLKNLPPEQRKQLQQLIEGNLNKLDFRNLNNLDIDQFQKHFDGFGQMPKLELKMGDLMEKGIQHKHRIKMVDPDGSITLETNGDQKSIELHDADGKLQYAGPFNNEEDKLKIPENLRARANTLKLGMPKARLQPKLEKLDGIGDLERMPMEMQKQLEDLLKNFEGVGAAPKILPEGFAFPKAGQMRNGQALMQKFEPNFNKDGANKTASRSLIDQRGNRYIYKETKDGKEIEIKDADDKLLFSGPYNSSVDKEMVPEEYRPSLERLETMGATNRFEMKLVP